MTRRLDAVERAGRLIALFCDDARAFGDLVAVDPSDVPATERSLLDHHRHMTVTMERHHGSAVELQVVAERRGDPAERGWYAREIVLRRGDAAIVQYGIVRIDLAAIEPTAAAAILAKSAPLGRILVSAGVLCDVQHVALLRIEAGPHLHACVGQATTLFGRVAEIAVAGRPAIELLEVVVPTPNAQRG
jgi:hypothetical protein